MSAVETIRLSVLLRFLLPLAITLMARDLAGPFVNGGMARMPGATETLAGFGLAWGLVFLVASPLSMVSQLSLVLAKNEASHRRLRSWVAGGGIFLCGAVAILAVTPLGGWVLSVLHAVDEGLAGQTRLGLLLFVPFPLLEGGVRYYSGFLVKAHRTEVITLGTVARVGCSILTVIALLPMPLVRDKPMLLPAAVVYAGLIAEAFVVGWGYRRFGRRQAAKAGDDIITFRYAAGFFYPLALVMVLQAASRPMVNLFVSRGENGAESLAVLTIVYPLGHLLYGWLNELRNLPPAFRDIAGSAAPIRRLVRVCGFLSFCAMVLAFWTPAGGFILREMLGLPEPLAAQCRAPLALFVFFPVVVTARAYYHGVAVVLERTESLTFSGPARIAIIFIMLTFLPSAGLGGATLGVAALLSGFVLETAVVVAALSRVLKNSV